MRTRPLHRASRDHHRSTKVAERAVVVMRKEAGRLPSCAETSTTLATDREASREPRPASPVTYVCLHVVLVATAGMGPAVDVQNLSVDEVGGAATGLDGNSSSSLLRRFHILSKLLAHDSEIPY